MSDSIASLQRKIISAHDLQAVVRTMKAMAGSSIGQYENAVRSLDDYYRAVQLGLSVCFRQAPQTPEIAPKTKDKGTIAAIIFGSDQGLVGQFNEVMAAFVKQTFAKLPGEKRVWCVGERLQTQLAGAELSLLEGFALPSSISTIPLLIGQILRALETEREKGTIAQVYLFHNQPKSDAIYAPVTQRLLPLDETWQRDLSTIPWPSKNLPEVIGGQTETRLALVREYLFVSLFRACAESLASENASRLAAMQRAEKNIDELLTDLTRSFHGLRQSSIDEELFDVVAGFEALSKPK